MRSKISAVLLGALLLLGLAACSKKEQPAQTAPATADQSTQQAPATPPAIQAAPEQQAAAPATAPAGAPVMEAPAAAPAAAPVAEQAPPPPPPQPIVIPAGRTVTVRVGDTLSSKTAQDGQTFTGTLANGIAVNGKVIVPAGSGVTGVVSEAKSAGRFKGEAILAIRLTSVNIKGVPHRVSTDEYVVTQKGKGKRSAVMIGGGTGGGALIGGLAGGGKGALIGGLIGAGAGTAGAAFTGNKELSIPAESAVSFKTTSSITIEPAQ
jgi:LysM repeat protein